MIMASTASKGRKKTPAKTGRGGAKGGKQKTSRKPSAAELQAQSAITSEIILIGVLALTILLFLCNFGVIGVIGNQISRVMFGIFGTMAYALPVLAFIAIAFGISNQGNRIASMKLTAGIILFFLLGVVCSLLFQGGTLSMDYSIRELYLESAEKRLGGGVISGSLAWGLHRLLGMVGTVLLLLVLVIICTVIITERSFVNGVKTSGRYVYETARSDAQRYRERSERRRKESEERYEQRRQANEERSKRLRQENEERSEKRREEELAREKERKQLARQKQLNAEQQREAKQRRKEEAQARQDADQIFRMEKKSTGIMADTTLRKASAGRREDMHEITITENPGQVTEQYTVRPVSVNLDADRRNETFPDAAVASGAAVLATSPIITAEESIPAAAADASGSAFMSHVRIHSAYLNNDSDTTPVPQDNTAEPADAFLSGMQDPVTSQPQADVYQDMKEVHYLEPKQPQQTEAFVPLESRVETSVVETSAPEVTLHMDTQPACASQELAPAQELEQSDSDKFDAVPPKLPWNDNMDAAEEPTVIPTPNLQSTGVPRPKAVPPKAPQLGIQKENIFILRSGNVLELNEEKAGVTGQVAAGAILVDGLGIGDVGNVVLRDRQHLAEDGIMIVVVALDSISGQIASGPDLVSRGFVYVKESDALMDEARDLMENVMEGCVSRGCTDWGRIKTAIKDNLGDFIWKKTKRRPMILPIIMEV